MCTWKIILGDRFVTRERIVLFDNTKALLILLVVMGHFVGYYTSFSTDMKIMFFLFIFFICPYLFLFQGYFQNQL